MIAVTCRNGELFTLDPDEIERVESTPDTVVHMVGGRTYVLAIGLDEVLEAIRDSRAEVVTRQRWLGLAEPAEGTADDGREATLRLERRARSRDGDSPGSPDERRPDGAAPES